MSKASYKSKKGESSSQYRQCVPPCPRFITSGDTHSLCVVCLGVKHAESALEGAGCPHCERLPLCMLRSWKTLFEGGVFASAPHGAGPAEAERQLHSWGSQLDLAEGMETGGSLSLSSPARSTARSLGSEAHSAVSSPQRAGSAFHLSPSEEEDVESADYSPIQSPQYEELLEVVTRAVAKLNIDWPADDQTEKQRSKLDERFLLIKSLPLCRSLPFFPDVHTEVLRSWKTPFSSRLFIPASTRKLYGLKWRLFTSWCGDQQLDPVNCPVGTVLEFLQARFSAGLSHSTLRVYVAALASYHAPMGGQSVGKDPLITRFLRGVMRLRPRVRSRVPPWNLAVVLEALCKPLFKPIEEVSERLLTLKTVLLLAISSLKRVGDLQALSVAPSFLDFAPAWRKLFLYPRAGYVPNLWFSCHSCAFHTLSRDLQFWRCGYLVPRSVSTQLDVPGGERPRLRM